MFRQGLSRLVRLQAAENCTCVHQLPTAVSRRLLSTCKRVGFVGPGNARRTATATARVPNTALRIPHGASNYATAPSPSPNRGPTAAYDAQVASNVIVNDQHQRSIVQLLQTMYDQLDRYDPPPIGPLPPPRKPSLMQRISTSRFFRTMDEELHQKNTATIPLPEPPKDLPKGLYLYGSVGCGKSFLMDLFYANLPPKYDNWKRRVHFHAFMMDVHRRGHKIKSQSGEAQDWIVLAARDLANEARVLCFDEFQVTDIADAMILRRLMEALRAHGVVTITTSNRAPDDLYKNGIQRDQFLPCIELIKQTFTVQCLDSNVDYRKRPRALKKVYLSPIDQSNKREFAELFDALTEDEPVIEHRPLSVWGRKINVPESTSRVAKFRFIDLCGKPLSAPDFLEITKTFETIFVEDVPQLGLDTKDQARRFILFIDAAYEAKTKLFILSDPPVQQVFSDEKKGSGDITDHQRAIMDELGLSAEVVGSSSIFTGDEEVFAFARALSRLNEMSGVQWNNGIGLSTPRGSGTNGYIQTNRSHLRSRDPRPSATSSLSSGPGSAFSRAPDKDILEHERRRRVEVKCLELQVSLEDDGVDQEEIEVQVDALRQKLLKESAAAAAAALTTTTGERGQIKMHDRHALAQAKEIENEKMRRALKISKDHQEGLAFDPQAQAALKVKRQEERQQRQEEQARIKAQLEADREKFQREREAQRKQHEREMEDDRRRHRDELDRRRRDHPRHRDDSPPTIQR
ncbi:ATPase [Microbotryomycetes sp. JL201]|nr:ATPase [Microbotryomycetes sp. JL201]